MHKSTQRRAIAIAEYLIKNACTVRTVAKAFGIGKSTAHKDLTERLPTIAPNLYEEVRRILDYNLSVRHIRGGESTRIKYIKTRSTNHNG